MGKEKMIFKFNQRAKLLYDRTDSFSFGIRIEYLGLGDIPYSFDILNMRGKHTKFINFNEWRIYSISSYNYFSRKVVVFNCSDPNGSNQRIETGGRTINSEIENGIPSMAKLLGDLLSCFYKISFYENYESVIKDKNFLKSTRLIYSEKINIIIMETW